MSKPKRIQRKRTKGWKMPEGAVYVGRPTKYGNVYQIMLGTTRESAVRLYRRHLDLSLGGMPTLQEIQAELRGKNLACWCPLDQPCHADVLLELANAEVSARGARA